MLGSENTNFRILSSLKYIFNQHLERVFVHFLHPETIKSKGYKSAFFNLNSILNYPLLTYYITIDTYINDVIEIQNVQFYQDNYYASLTNLVTKLNDKPLTHPIWMEYKFFFDSCMNITLLTITNKIEENNAELNEILQELINPSKLTSLCAIINDYLINLNKPIVHTESVLILRPINQVWKCFCNLDFWRTIYREKKYSLLLDENGGKDVVLKIINISNKNEKVYKVKNQIFLNDRISLRILKEFKYKNSIQHYISVSILSISQITCYVTFETEIITSVNLDFLKFLSQLHQYILKNLKSMTEKSPCEV